MVAKVFQLAAVPAGLALTSYGLYAMSDREPKGNVLNPQQLSIYSVPPRESTFIEEQPGRLQCIFTAVRQAVWPAVTWTKFACESVRSGVEDTVQFGKDSYVYLKNPPPEFLPRVGVISVSGLAGLILARKGSRLKKIAYPLGLTALGASVCYPAQAVIFAKVTGRKLYNTSHWTYDSVRSLWKTQPQKEDTSLPPAPVNKDAVSGEDRAETPSPEPISIRNTDPTTPQEPARVSDGSSADRSNKSGSEEPHPEGKFQPPADLSDHGQSSPEDVDLYSTRT